jgi:hypothetical protein
MRNFLSVVQEFRVEAGLTPEQIEAINDALTRFGESLDRADALHIQAQAATATKNDDRALAETLIRTLVEFIKVQPAITNTMLMGMQVTVDTGERTRRSPLKPENLVAEAEGAGRVHLEWDSGGNTAGVQYVVEVQLKEGGEFTLVDVVTRRRLIIENIPIGARLTYRVKARRNGETSAPSNLATVVV